MSSKWLTCETPCGADYTTCPICDNYDTTIPFCYKFRPHIAEENLKYICEERDLESSDDDDIEEKLQRIYYCIRCKIVFQVGEVFIERGCTSSTYFAEMITFFTLDNKHYRFIPKFTSFSKCKELIKKMSHIIWDKILKKEMKVGDVPTTI
jgi:hypothetical protein